VAHDATTLAGYALELCQAIVQTDHARVSLPHPLTVRIALHAGPVFEEEDPLTGRANYYGAHVNRAARLEPITVPGCVYASEPFVAMLAAEQACAQQDSFACQYVGTISLAKDFGLQPSTAVRKKRAVPTR